MQSEREKEASTRKAYDVTVRTSAFTLRETENHEWVSAQRRYLI